MTGLGDRVEILHGSALSLPVQDNSFDRAYSQAALMNIADKQGVFREAYRVLSRGGLYHFNVWDSFDFNPFARISHEIVGRFFGQQAPSFFTVPSAARSTSVAGASFIHLGK